MSVFVKVKAELKKALDNEKVALVKSSERRVLSESAHVMTDTLQVCLDGDIFVECSRISNPMLGGVCYHTYNCSDKTFSADECEDLFKFLEGYDQTCSLLGKLEKINGLNVTEEER